MPHFTLRQEIEQLEQMGRDAHREGRFAAAERFYDKAVAAPSGWTTARP